MRISINAKSVNGGASSLTGNFSTFLKKQNEVVSSLKTVQTKTKAASGGVGNMSSALQSLEKRIKQETNLQNSAKSVQKKLDDFVDLAERVDKQVASAVEKNRNAFYKQYPHLEPDNAFEAAWKWLCGGAENIAKGIAAGWEAIKSWASDLWKRTVNIYLKHKKLFDTIAVIGLAVIAIVGVVTAGPAVLVGALVAFGVPAATAATVSAAIAATAIISTALAAALNVTDVWFEIDNPIFNGFQTVFNWISGITTFAIDAVQLVTALKSFVTALKGASKIGGEAGEILLKEGMEISDEVGEKLIKETAEISDEVGEALINETAQFGDEAAEILSKEGVDFSKESTEKILKDTVKIGDEAGGKLVPEAITLDDEALNSLQKGEMRKFLDNVKDLVKKEKGYTKKVGNFGEMTQDQMMISKGYKRLHLNSITDLDDAIHQGIDGVYYKVLDDDKIEFVIAEAKYNTSRLSTDTKGFKQMSKEWIEDRLKNIELKDVKINGKTVDADMIINNGYISQLTNVMPDGTIKYSYLDEFAKKLPNFKNIDFKLPDMDNTIGDVFKANKISIPNSQSAVNPNVLRGGTSMFPDLPKTTGTKPVKVEIPEFAR